MPQPYKVFISAEFVNRNAELERVQAVLKEKSRSVIIFEGERGSGKTSLLFELYRHLDQQTELRPFLVSLSSYSAPEFESKENIWLHSEDDFQKDNIPNLLDRLARYLEIDFIESRDPDIQKEYLARGLAYRAAKTVPIILVDSIYECPEIISIEIEKYVLAPLLTSEHVFLVLSGRGKRPAWSRPELQNAEIFDLPPLLEEHVKEQLEKMKSARAAEYRQIADLSDGYPLIVRVMGESKKDLTNALNDAIDIIIQDVLPKNVNDERKYTETRSQIEKLSLVGIPFRIPDVEDYLYPNDPEQRTKTNNLVNLLLESRLLRYEGKGYQINRSVINPIRKWLNLQRQRADYQDNLLQLKRVSKKLQEDYPSASTWYQRMIPTNLITAQH